MILSVVTVLRQNGKKIKQKFEFQAVENLCLDHSPLTPILSPHKIQTFSKVSKCRCIRLLLAASSIPV